MPVLDQIQEASVKLFDAAEKGNSRARSAAEAMVVKFQDGELPLADKMPSIDLPMADKLPEPKKAVDAYFDFMASGIKANRTLADKLFTSLGGASETIVDVASTVVEKTQDVAETATEAVADTAEAATEAVADTAEAATEAVADTAEAAVAETTEAAEAVVAQAEATVAEAAATTQD